MSQCKEPMRCECGLCHFDWPHRCATTFYCMREAGHSGRHKWDRWHEAWHGHDAWCQAPIPVKEPR